MRTHHFVAMAVLLSAGCLTLAWRPMPPGQRWVRVAAEQALPGFAPSLRQVPPAVDAVLLDYARAGDRLLVAQAEAALLRHPAITPRVLSRYGRDPGFQAVLRQYGADVVLPVAYFLDHRVASLAAVHYLGSHLSELQNHLSAWWEGKPVSLGPAQSGPLTPLERGRYAIACIAGDGYDFIGQFRATASQQVAWIQSERALEDLDAWFAGGIRRLDSKLQTGRPVSLGDAGGAGLDVAALAALPALKLAQGLRRADRGARAADDAERAATRRPARPRAGGFVRRIGRHARWPARLGAAYLVLRHPALVSDWLAALARSVGLPVSLTVFAGWVLLLAPLLTLALGVWRLLAWPARGLWRGARWLGGRRLRPRVARIGA